MNVSLELWTSLSIQVIVLILSILFNRRRSCQQVILVPRHSSQFDPPSLFRASINGSQQVDPRHCCFMDTGTQLPPLPGWVSARREVAPISISIT